MVCAAVRLAGLSLVLMAWLSGTALAQVESGEILGRVTDRTGALLPGVTVTLEGATLLQQVTAVTAESGAYRFPRVPTGTYRLTYQLSGFGSLIREGVRVETAFNVEINVELNLSTVTESVTVSGASPIIDVANTRTGANFTRETLDAVPSARDPWVILEQTPGMVMDRQNVGGNQSGQQSSFLAHGSSANQQWNVNGATVTDMAAGSSPGYYDFDSFEEIQISTGGGDASQEAAGVAINVITKSGSNTFRGGAKYLYVSDALQGSNIDDQLRAQGAGLGNPIRSIEEYGFDVGGPIVRNRFWYWGAVSGNDIVNAQVGFLKPGCTDPNDINCLEDDATFLDNYNLKLDYQWTQGQKSGFFWKRGAKIRNARNAGPFNPFETTVRQNSPGIGDLQASHQWMVNDRLSLDGKFTYSNSSFDLDFQEGVSGIQPSFDIVTTMNGRSTTANYYERPTYETRGDGNLFLPAFLGGDHATKFGVRYRNTPYSQKTVSGGGAIARFRSGVPAEAEMRRDGYTTRDLWQFSMYLNDTIRAGRWTWSLGLRWDYQDDEALAASVPANSILPDLLPALQFPGADSGVTYSNVSPRFGVNYDLTGDGKTLLKFTANRYYGLGIYTAGTISPTGQTTLRYGWADVNGDGFVQRNELDLSRILNNSSNYNPNDPTSVRAPASINPGLENDITDEVLVSFDRELASNFGVGISYIWRHYHNGTWQPYTGVPSADYVARSMTANCGNASCDQPGYTVTYWELPYARPAESVLSNQDFLRAYQGIELTARKRFSNRWMMMGAFTYNDTSAHHGGPDVSYQDPTNIAQQDGRQLGTLNVRWVAKLSGMYQLPWGLSTGAFLNMREGFPFYPNILTPNRPGGLGTASVDIYPIATKRYDTMTLFDWRIDKRIPIGGSRRLDLMATLFNVFNANTVLGRTQRQNASNANNVTSLLSPRVLNVQARFVF